VLFHGRGRDCSTGRQRRIACSVQLVQHVWRRGQRDLPSSSSRSFSFDMFIIVGIFLQQRTQRFKELFSLEYRS